MKNVIYSQLMQTPAPSNQERDPSLFESTPFNLDESMNSMSSSVKSNQSSAHLKRPRSFQQLTLSKVNSSANINNNTNVPPGSTKKVNAPSSNRNTLHYATLTKPLKFGSLTSDNTSTNQPPTSATKNPNTQQPISRGPPPKTPPKSSNTKVSSLTMHPHQLRQQ
jgi:hypothetical protein